MDIDVFSSAQPQVGEFATFREIGDGYQGTYVDVREGRDSFGNDQLIYVLQDKKNGKVWNVGIKKTNVVVVERMENTRFGQVVGFKLDGRKESKRHPGQTFNVINVYADPALVDQAWIDNQKAIEAQYGPRPAPLEKSQPTALAKESPADDWDIGVPFTAPTNLEAAKANLPTTPAKPENEAVNAIRTLAKTKGLTNDSMTQEEADNAITQYTGLSLVEENLTKIIIKLTSYTAAN